MNEIVRTTNRQTTPERDFELETATKYLISWTPTDPMATVGLTRSLTMEERRRIRDRIKVLEAALGERDPRLVDRAVNSMMLSFPSGRAGGDEAEAVIRAYGYALADTPPWAASEAVKRFIRGQVPNANSAFPPSGAELHDEAAKVVAPWRAEMQKWQRVLDGEVLDKVHAGISETPSGN